MADLNFGRNLFPAKKDEIIASFDFVDVAEGTGVVRYQGFTNILGTGPIQATATSGAALDRPSNINLSQQNWTDKTDTNNTARHKSQEINFDLSQFNLPKTLKGSATTNITWGVKGITSVTSAAILINIQKYDGTTAVTIATGSGAEIVDNQAFQQQDTIPITMPQTHFKKGETLRINTQLWIYTTDASYISTIYHHVNEPNNSSGALLITMPFLINQ